MLCLRHRALFTGRMHTPRLVLFPLLSPSQEVQVMCRVWSGCFSSNDENQFTFTAEWSERKHGLFSFHSPVSTARTTRTTRALLRAEAIHANLHAPHKQFAEQIKSKMTTITTTMTARWTSKRAPAPLFATRPEKRRQILKGISQAFCSQVDIYNCRQCNEPH